MVSQYLVSSDPFAGSAATSKGQGAASRRTQPGYGAGDDARDGRSFADHLATSKSETETRSRHTGTEQKSTAQDKKTASGEAHTSATKSKHGKGSRDSAPADQSQASTSAPSDTPSGTKDGAASPADKGKGNAETKATDAVATILENASDGPQPTASPVLPQALSQTDDMTLAAGTQAGQEGTSPFAQEGTADTDTSQTAQKQANPAPTLPNTQAGQTQAGQTQTGQTETGQSLTTGQTDASMPAKGAAQTGQTQAGQTQTDQTQTDQTQAGQTQAGQTDPGSSLATSQTDASMPAKGTAQATSTADQRDGQPATGQSAAASLQQSGQTPAPSVQPMPSEADRSASSVSTEDSQTTDPATSAEAKSGAGAIGAGATDAASRQDQALPSSKPMDSAASSGPDETEAKAGAAGSASAELAQQQSDAAQASASTPDMAASAQSGGEATARIDSDTDAETGATQPKPADASAKSDPELAAKRPETGIDQQAAQEDGTLEATAAIAVDTVADAPESDDQMAPAAPKEQAAPASATQEKTAPGRSASMSTPSGTGQTADTSLVKSQLQERQGDTATDFAGDDGSTRELSDKVKSTPDSQISNSQSKEHVSQQAIHAPKGEAFSKMMAQMKVQQGLAGLASQDDIASQSDSMSSLSSDPSAIRLTGMENFGRTGQMPPQASLANSQALAAQISKFAGKGQTRFEIRLDPAELGKVDVKLTIGSDGQTRAHIFVERSETLDFLMRDQRMLERSLQQSGINLEDQGLEFSMMNDGGQHQELAQHDTDQEFHSSSETKGADEIAAADTDTVPDLPHRYGGNYMATTGLDMTI